MRAIFSFSVGESAVSRQFLSLCKELKSRGHKVTIVSWGTSSLQSTDLEIFNFPSRRPTKLKDFIFLLKLFSKKKPDLIVANFGSVNLMMLTGFLHGAPVRIAWYHTLSSQLELDWKKSRILFHLLRFRKKLFYSFTTVFIANSKAAALDLSSQYSINTDKIKIFPNAVSSKIKQVNAKQLGETKHLIFIGRIDHSKGVDILIEAFRMVHQRHSKFKLTIVGSGSFKSELENLVDEYGLNGHCEFLGSVPNNEVPKYFESAHLALVPSRYEAFGIVAIEALMTGTPVVASRTGGLAEIIRDGIDGFLVEPENPVALAEAILKVFEDESKYFQMCKNARQRFDENFEVSKVVKNQADWLESLFSKK